MTVVTPMAMMILSVVMPAISRAVVTATIGLGASNAAQCEADGKQDGRDLFHVGFALRVRMAK